MAINEEPNVPPCSEKCAFFYTTQLFISETNKALDEAHEKMSLAAEGSVEREALLLFSKMLIRLETSMVEQLGKLPNVHLVETIEQ